MRSRQSTRRVLLTLIALLPAVFALAAEKKYGPGVSDAEIKIGETAPYSGAVSAYGTWAKPCLSASQPSFRPLQYGRRGLQPGLHLAR